MAPPAAGCHWAESRQSQQAETGHKRPVRIVPVLVSKRSATVIIRGQKHKAKNRHEKALFSPALLLVICDLQK
tara:strand:+ start:167 stop:385 length:219 start_codon:yes stop_codon:yes gene_type:complete